MSYTRELDDTRRFGEPGRHLWTTLMGNTCGRHLWTTPVGGASVNAGTGNPARLHESADDAKQKDDVIMALELENRGKGRAALGAQYGCLPA
eukprot:gene11542-biopygen8440